MKTKRGRGRPKLELDENRIVNLARVGTSTRDIAALLGCDEGVLRRGDWKDIINRARAERRASIHKMQWDAAKGNPTMLIWLGKNELGQTDKQAHEYAGELTVTHDVDFSGLTDDELLKFERAFSERAGGIGAPGRN